MTAHKISVEMGFEYVFNGPFSFFGQDQVFFNIPQGVNNRGFTLTLNIISRFAQTAGVKLLDIHDAKLPF
jgi:hypothetical protein